MAQVLSRDINTSFQVLNPTLLFCFVNSISYLFIVKPCFFSNPGGGNAFSTFFDKAHNRVK